MKPPLTRSSSVVSLAAPGRPHLYAQHCIMKCVHCGEHDGAAAAAWALGIVHLCMTGAHAAFEHPVGLPASALPPSLHMHSKKRSRQLDASLSPTSPRSSPPFPTRSLSGVNTQSVSPPGFRGVAALPSLSAASPSTSEERGGREAPERAGVWRGKSGHVGLGERWREREGAQG